MLCKLDDDIPFEIGFALACGFMSGFGAKHCIVAVAGKGLKRQAIHVLYAMIKAVQFAALPFFCF